MMDGWDMNGWGWAWMSLSMAIGVAVVALLVVLLVRGSTAADRRPGQDDALTVLRRRYASGEIDQDEYRRRRTELGG
jgi:putative membrane protein